MKAKRTFPPLLVFLVLVVSLMVILSSCNSGAITSQSQTTTISSEQAYRVKIEAVIDRFYNHRTDYNAEVERLGAQFSSATTEIKQRMIIQQLIEHLEDAQEWFRQDRDDFAVILPPAKFRDAHLLINSVLNDYVGAISAYITYYSVNLNSGTTDLQTANRASALLRTANENLQRSAYIYADLFEGS